MPRELRSRPNGSTGIDYAEEDDRSSSIENEEKKDQALKETHPRIHIKMTSPYVMIITGLQPHHFTDLSRQGTDLSVKSKRSNFLNVQTKSSPRKRTLYEEFQDLSSPKRQKVEDINHQPAEANGSTVQNSSKAEESDSIQRNGVQSLTPRLSPFVEDDRDIKDFDLADIQTQPASPTPSARSASAIPSIAVSPLPSRPTSPTDPNELKDSDLPGPFLSRSNTPPPFTDTANAILFDRYPPISNPNTFIKTLTSHPPKSRSTTTLLAIAHATQAALLAWQDEYLALDAITAPVSLPPKRPALGGRDPEEPALYEQHKEISLWGHILGVQGVQRTPVIGARAKANKYGPYRGLGDAAEALQEGKRLRRRGADARLADGALPPASEEDVIEKRARKPVRRFDAGTNGIAGRARQGEGEYEGEGPRKRGRLGELKGYESATASQSPTPDGDSFEYGRSLARRGRGGLRGRGSGLARTGPSPVESGRAAARGRVKSEKRSESMMAWWAERKRKAAELKNSELRERVHKGSVEGTPGATGMYAMESVDGAMYQGMGSFQGRVRS